MRAVVIAGAKKSGKTALLALVAEALERQGKQVAVVKYSNHPLEKGNTDAFWLMRENRTVVNASPEETAILWPGKLNFEDLVRHLCADVLLLEGGDAPITIPRIVCLREDEEDLAVLEECGMLTVLATVGGRESTLPVPHYAEADPLAADSLAGVILAAGRLL